MPLEDLRSTMQAIALVMAALLAGLCARPAGAADFDGITIVDLKGAQNSEEFPSGEALVVFVSGKGSYAAVVTRPGSYSGCQSLAVPDSYTGDTIAFGLDVPRQVRQQRLDTYCPPFQLKISDQGTVRISAGKYFRTTRKVIAKIPFKPVDFAGFPFTKYDIKGVRLGPVTDSGNIHPLSAAGYSDDRSRGYQKTIRTDEGPTALLGEAAASEITGWPWPVLYSAQFGERFKQMPTQATMDDVIKQRYGPPSSRREGSGYRLWVFGLDGHQINLDGDAKGPCAASIDGSLKRDPLNRVISFNWNSNSSDLGPWGCSLIMEMNAGSGSDGGVEGYSIRMWSGYVAAINHFYQRISETETLRKKVQAMLSRKPKL